MYSFRAEYQRLWFIFGRKKNLENCVISLPPSGYMDAYWRIIKKVNAITIVLSDKPENILKKLKFMNIESKKIEKT